MRNLMLPFTLLALLMAQPVLGTEGVKDRWAVKTDTPNCYQTESTATITATTAGKLDTCADNQYTIDKLAADLGSPPGVRNRDKRYQRAKIPVYTNPLGLKEGDTVTTIGYLQLVAREGDGDFHVQITDTPLASDGVVLIVELPDPRFIKDTKYKAKVATARDTLVALVGRNPSANGSLVEPAPLISVTGALFYDSAHLNRDGSAQARGKGGMHSHTLWELHPVWAVSRIETPATREPVPSDAG